MWRCAAAACALAVGAEMVYLAWKSRKVDVIEVIEFAGVSENCNFKHCNDTRCSFHNLNRIVSYINSAQVSLDLCLYILTSEQLMNAVVNAHKRGVAVRLIIDYDMAHSSGSSALNLTNKGIQIRSKAVTFLMHHKFCLIDSNRRIDELKNRFSMFSRPNGQLVMSGSLNWSKNACLMNYENILVTSLDPIVFSYQKIFDTLWAEFIPLALEL